METHRFSCKDKFPAQGLIKKVMLTLFWDEKIHDYWLHKKGATVNRSAYWQILRKNSHVTHIHTLIYIYIYIYTTHSLEYHKIISFPTFSTSSLAQSIGLWNTPNASPCLFPLLAQSTGAAEYTERISAEWFDWSKECPGYDTKNLMVRLK